VAQLKRAGVAAVYTPKDFDITRIVHEIVGLLDTDTDAAERNGRAVNGSA